MNNESKSQAALELRKGELIEEKLREYFLSLGFYVLRGVEYKFENEIVTDIDIYVYIRTSSLIRHRINVDIKNKKSPQVYERVIWANGIMKLLNFDSCIVATTSNKPHIQKFSQLHGTRILDGNFLRRLKDNENNNRLTEEDFKTIISTIKCYRNGKIIPFKKIYDDSKSRLLTNLDFSSFNEILLDIKLVIEELTITRQHKAPLTRLLYVLMSHSFIIIDYILKDLAFLDQVTKEEKIVEGISYGNLGKDGFEKMFLMASQLADNENALDYDKDYIISQSNILKDFLSKNENAKMLYTWAKDFESFSFSKGLISPNNLDLPLKSIFGILLDYYSLDRIKFFTNFPS